MAVPQHVLVPVDFSRPSVGVVAGLEELGIELEKVTLLHIIDKESKKGTGATLNLAPDAKETGQRLLAHYRTELEGFRQAHMPTLGAFEVDCDVQEADDAAKRICSRAQELGVSLIAIATHGRTGLSHLLLGSVAEHVVQRAPCPTLVLRRS